MNKVVCDVCGKDVDSNKKNWRVEIKITSLNMDYRPGLIPTSVDLCLSCQKEVQYLLQQRRKLTKAEEDSSEALAEIAQAD